jgi:hypothetical protein
LRVTIYAGEDMKSLMLLFVLVLSVNVSAQESESAAEHADRLKGQLIDVQGKEEALRTHLQQLDEAIKPENIERSFAGVGSTRPEELREHRRRQLSIERDGVLSQLQTLETARLRLESAIATAETQAYHDSARPRPSDTNQILMAAGGIPLWFVFAGGGSVALLALGGGALLYRRKRSANSHQSLD